MATSLHEPTPFSFCLIGDIYEPYLHLANRVMQDLRSYLIQPPDKNFLDELVWQFYQQVLDTMLENSRSNPPIFKYPPRMATEEGNWATRVSVQKKEYFNYFYHPLRNAVDMILDTNLEVPEDDLVRNRVVKYMTDFLHEVIQELERHILRYIEYQVHNQDSTTAFSLDPKSLFYSFYETYQLYHTRPQSIPEEETGDAQPFGFRYEVQGLEVEQYHRWSFSLFYRGQLHLHPVDADMV